MTQRDDREPAGGPGIAAAEGGSVKSRRLGQICVGANILANYEAISDYQLTFGAIKFACVVFDEAQKIKTPSARMTTAAKGLNTDFVLAMTGTPVENRLADLWCISDIDWQSNPENVTKFASLLGLPVTVVPHAGHQLPKEYVSLLLDNL